MSILAISGRLRGMNGNNGRRCCALLLGGAAAVPSHAGCWAKKAGLAGCLGGRWLAWDCRQPQLEQAQLEQAQACP